VLETERRADIFEVRHLQVHAVTGCPNGLRLREQTQPRALPVAFPVAGATHDSWQALRGDVPEELRGIYVGGGRAMVGKKGKIMTTAGPSILD